MKPFRIGRHLNRVLLRTFDSREVAKFERGYEELAHKVCDMLNEEYLKGES